jgi:hypothetical protein
MQGAVHRNADYYELDWTEVTGELCVTRVRPVSYLSPSVTLRHAGCKWGGGAGGLAPPPWVAESKKRQTLRRNEYFKFKKNDFQLSMNFKLLSQIKGKSMYDCDFLNFVISVMGGNFDYSSRTPNYLATPLALLRRTVW